jgi:membrane protein
MKNEKPSEESEHGRYADKPQQIPKRGWWDILVRVNQQMSDDNLDIVAAGISFYIFLAVFPALGALVSIYGLLVTPATVQSQVAQMAGFLPPEASQLINQILSQVVSRSGQSLGLGLIVSIVLGLWSANNGTKALIKGLNISYDQRENRNFFVLTGTSLLFTLCAVLVVMISLAFVIGLPIALNAITLPQIFKTVVSLSRWPILALITLLGLAITYRYAPARENAKWRWVTWGAALATIIWLAGSFGFSFYVEHFGNYNATYGSVAAVVILLFWFLLSSYAILLGAEINAETERQTKKDTTTGESKPMGKRGASPADDLGQAA